MSRQKSPYEWEIAHRTSWGDPDRKLNDAALNEEHDGGDFDARQIDALKQMARDHIEVYAEWPLGSRRTSRRASRATSASFRKADSA